MGPVCAAFESRPPANSVRRPHGIWRPNSFTAIDRANDVVRKHVSSPTYKLSRRYGSLSCRGRAAYDGLSNAHHHQGSMH